MTVMRDSEIALDQRRLYKGIFKNDGLTVIKMFFSKFHLVNDRKTGLLKSDRLTIVTTRPFHCDDQPS